MFAYMFACIDLRPKSCCMHACIYACYSVWNCMRAKCCEQGWAHTFTFTYKHADPELVTRAQAPIGAPPWGSVGSKPAECKRGRKRERQRETERQRDREREREPGIMFSIVFPCFPNKRLMDIIYIYKYNKPARSLRWWDPDRLPIVSECFREV